MDDIVLEIKNLSKSFAKNKVLDGINLTVKKGTVLGLMGENGAGKSTMMKCLFGIYAKDEGSVAAPTAGLHFTEDILNTLQTKGVEIIYVTLNVGMGTFRPVKCDKIEDHIMHSETFEISEEAAVKINKAMADGKKIVAVGTTTVRTLETAFKKYGCIKACRDSSELFIYPPYEFKVIDKLITNFHLPKSTLLMLVSALAGKEFIFKAYKEAVENRYRFFSYGDCMLIE